MAGRTRDRQRRERQQAAADAAREAQRRSARRRLLLLAGAGGAVVAVVLLVVVLTRGGGRKSNVSADAPATSSTVAASKDCVPVADPLPAGAPAVPVKTGAPPSQLIKEDLKVGTGAV